MALYDELIQILKDKNDADCTHAATIISHLQATVKFYNSDDAIFDDEKEKRPVLVSLDRPDPFHEIVMHEINGTGIFVYDKGTIL